MTSTPIISITGLSVTYFPGKPNEVWALRDINLEIFSGQFIIFFGPSGCGKSTLLYSIAGLERNISGSIKVKDGDLKTMHQHELEQYHQRTLGMIFQSYYLIPSLTVIQNVAMPQMAISESKGNRETRALALLKRFGVEAQAYKLPGELSGGQQQRVAICRSLMNEPDILVADEPVGNLDSKSSQEVMDLLREINDVHGKTVILVTHDPSHLHHAHKVFYLRDGHLIGTKDNSPDERKMSLVEKQTKDQSAKMAESLSHWANTYVKDNYQKDAISAAIKAQQILADVVGHMTRGDFSRLEQKVANLLLHREHEPDQIVGHLTRDVMQSGGGLTQAQAEKIANQISDRMTEAELIEQTDQRSRTSTAQREAQVRELRRYVFEHFGLNNVHSPLTDAVDTIIHERLQGLLNRRGVLKRLDLPLAQGGAGLHHRLAHNMSIQLESIMPFSRLDEDVIGPEKPADIQLSPSKPILPDASAPTQS